MPVFSYKAVDRNGAIVRGMVEGMDMDIAYDSIMSSGLHVVNITKANRLIASASKKLSARKIRRTDIIEFANNMSVMLRAGVPIISVLSDLSETTENKFFREEINSIKRMVEHGSRFSDAIAAHQEIFPDIFVRIVVIGEETGGLDKSLSDVATHLQKMEDLRAAIKRALIYPIFAIVTTLGALLFWLVYVLPKVIVIFKDMGTTLPLSTRILIAISKFSQSYWYLIISMPVIAFLIIKALRQKKETRYYMDLLKIKLPVMKHIIYNKLLALFSEQLRILTVAGIPVNRSFAIISHVIGNDVFCIAIDKSLENIAAGSMISEALKKYKVFPPMVIRMIQIGETSGTLDQQFAYLSDYYLKKLDDVTEKLGKMIEPIVISVIGLMFAFIIVGLLFPIYDLITTIGK